MYQDAFPLKYKRKKQKKAYRQTQNQRMQSGQSGAFWSLVDEATSYTFKGQSNSRKAWFYRPH